MKTMSNVDVFAICDELNELIKGARVDKSFQPRKDTISIRFHITGHGRVDIVFQAGKRMHISQYPMVNPQIPPSFPMLLRKRIKGATVISVKQHNFDRVVEIKLKKDAEYSLIIELFDKGNIILLDENKNIIAPLKRIITSERDISSKREYEYPKERGINPLTLDKNKLNEIFKNSDTDLIRTLAINNLGGKYSEEIIKRSKLDKNKIANELNTVEIDLIFETINELFKPLIDHNFKALIIKEEEKDIDVIPFELEIYEDKEKVEFETFNEAADEFFSKNINKDIKNQEEKLWEKKINKFKKRLYLQEETLKKFHRTIEDSTKKGDLLYANYSEIEKIMKVVLDAKNNGYSWKEIAKIIKKARKNGMADAQAIESIDNMGKVNLKIDDMNVSVDSYSSIPENAEVYYEKSKKAKRKIKGAEIAIEKTKKQIEDIESKKEIAIEKVKFNKKRVKKELKWYEKLRWCLSGDGNLIIGGRDTHTNDLVVKKHMDNNDIYMHTDIHGASSVIIKKSVDEGEISDQTLKDAAVFSVCFSNSWKNGYSTGDTYWVYPNQVSKTPKSGEYLAKGAFIISGSKNYMRGVPLKLAIGIVDYEGKRLMASSEEAMQKYTQDYVLIKPGFTKKEKIAKDILYKINKENIISLDDLVRVLPSGKCDFV